MRTEKGMRIVKTRSIPNVDSDRLRDSLAQTHAHIHTPEGFYSFSGPRRNMVDFGLRGLKIAAELVKRGEPTGIIDCRFCDGSTPVPASCR